jgi:alpha-L-fucosidase
MLQHGDPHGTVWRPGETDVSIRPGWFYHPEQDARVRDVDNLVGLYFTSVGRNSKLLLNVPPTPAGRIHATDAARLHGMHERLTALFAEDLSGRLPATVGIADLREDITRGQTVARYTLERRSNGVWRALSRGTTIGYRKLDRFDPVPVEAVRVRVEESVGGEGTVALSLYA